MTAVVRDRYGSADSLSVRTVECPATAANEVLIEVHAAGVDRGTVHLMTGEPYLMRLAGFGVIRPKQQTLGMDVAGRVAAAGSEVTRFAVGDAVFGIARGAFAQYAAASEQRLAHMPTGFSFEAAAVSPVSGITALQALTDVGGLEAGQRVLVIGASGGVGTFAVQLAKALGAHVTGVAGSRNIELVGSLGADVVIDHQREDFVGRGERYDLVIDIGGRNSIRRLRSVLTRSGALVIVGGEGGNRFTGGIGRQVRAMALSPFVAQSLRVFISREHHSFIERLAAHLESGAVRPAVTQRFDLDGVPRAIDALAKGRSSGKSVIMVREPTDGSAS